MEILVLIAVYIIVVYLGLKFLQGAAWKSSR